MYEKRDSSVDGVNDLSDALHDLHSGLDDLSDAGNDLRDAADAMFDAALSQASQTTAAVGAGTLTRENYAEVLDTLAAADPRFAALKEQLDASRSFAEGVSGYVDGAADAADGSGEISENVDEFRDDLLDFIDEAADIDFHNITSFVQREANPRIGASLAKVGMYHVGGYIAGAIILVLFAYICSVFVISTIENESQFIGALYAMGVHRQKILAHYITLPVVVTFIGGVIGTAVGFSPIGRGMLTASVIGPYSVPAVENHYSPLLLLYGILMPPVLAALRCSLPTAIATPTTGSAGTGSFCALPTAPHQMTAAPPSA